MSASAHALASHTVEVPASKRAGVMFTDEASGFDHPWGTPTGWIMFCEVQGEQFTAEELRALADEMDAAARARGVEGRHDV